MSDQVTREAAGPGGPQCLRALRDDEITTSTEAVRSACRSLIVDEGTKPSIAKVASRSALSPSTVNREHCKTILADYRRRYDLVSAGLPLETALALTEEEVLRRTPKEPVADMTVGAEVARLHARIAQLEMELERRDGQLYHVLGTVRSLRGTLRWHRKDHARLVLELEALGGEPMTPRKSRKWQEDFQSSPMPEMDDDEDDDDDDDDRRGGRQGRPAP